MKLNKIITAVIATVVLGTSSILGAAETPTINSIKTPVLLAYYGQVNSNGTVRTNYVNGYTKSNGTHVNGYYRS